MSDRDRADLEAFIDRGDEHAFASVMQRHAGPVFAVCRRALGDAEDAADATQAVFLTLAAKAAQVRSHPCPSAWLHVVAVNIARRSAASLAARRARERLAGAALADSGAGRGDDELRAALDDALARLPESLRAPIVLHHLDGLPVEEVARRLGLRRSTLSMRLAKGLRLLRRALTRRGPPLEAASLAALLAPSASVGWTATHAAAVVKAANALAAGDAAAAGAVSGKALGLAKGALKTLMLAKLKLAAAVVAAAVVVGAGSAATARRLVARQALPEAAAANAVAWWTFDDDRPGHDRSGHGHDLVLPDAPRLVAGAHGRALALDGQACEAPSLAGAAFPASGTLAFRLELAPTARDRDAMLLDGWGARNHLLMLLDAGAGRIDVRFARVHPDEAGPRDFPDAFSPYPGATDAVASWTAAATPGAWRHYAIAWDASRATGAFYVDGALVASEPLPDGWRPDGQRLRFGGAGAIDDIVLCDRALDAADIATLADRPATGDAMHPIRTAALAATLVGAAAAADADAPFAPLPEGDAGIAAKHPGDAGIAGDPTVLFADGFESYGAVDELAKTWDLCVDRTVRLTSDPANVHSGGKAVEFVIPVTDHEAGSSVAKRIAPERDLVFLRCYAKLDPAFDIVGSSHNGFGVSAHYDIDGRATPGIPADGKNKFLVMCECWRGEAKTPNPGELNLYVYHPEQRSQWGDHFFCNGDVMPNTSLKFPYAKGFTARPQIVPPLGRWFCYELMVKANTPGSRDGRMAIWVEGKLVADFPGIRLRDVDTLTMDKCAFGLHIHDGAKVETRKWCDDIVVATSYIGPMAKPKAAKPAR